MALVLVCYLVAAAGYAAFQWTVHILIYRQFAVVPVDAFPAYEREHQRRISFLVGPLFTALTISTGWLLVDRPPGVALWAILLAGALVAGILAATAFVAVPLHARLSKGWDTASYRRLLRADLARTLAATGTLVLAIAFTRA